MVGKNQLTMYSNMRGVAPDSLQYTPNVLKQVPPQMVCTASTMPSGFVDPYARPLAVKDLTSFVDTLPKSVAVKAMVAQGNHGYDRQALSQGVLQTNSFMRPQSASLVPLEAVMGRKEMNGPRPVCCQNEIIRPDAQVTRVTQVNGVRSRPSQLRYSTRSLSTQWLNGLAQSGTAQARMAQPGTAQTGISGAKRGMSPNPYGPVLASSSSGQVIPVRFGTSNGYLQNGAAVGMSGGPNTAARESILSANRVTSAYRSVSTEADRGFGGLEQNPGVGSTGELDELCSLCSSNLCYQHHRRCDDATSLRNQTICDRQSATLQGVPTRCTNSLVAMAVRTGAAMVYDTCADSVPGNIRRYTPDSDVAQVRKQVKVDMNTVTALAEKIRNSSIETAVYADSIPGNERCRFEPRSQLRKCSPSLVNVSRDVQKPPEDLETRTKATTASTNTTNTSKPQPEVANKPPSGALNKPVVGLGPRNQLISQEKLKRMPVTNTITGSPFPTKPLSSQELGLISKPRPLPPSPQVRNISRASSGKAAHPSNQKPKPLVENESHSSIYMDAVEEESLLGNNDTELDSLDDEDGSDDFNSYLSDEESSYGTGHSSPSPIIQGQARSISAKLPAKSVARRTHDNDLPSRKISTGSKSAGNRPSPMTLTSLLNETQIDSEPQPSLTESLFSNIPPTINFVLEGQKVEPLPSEFRKLLKWRMSPITPNVVKQCIARSGFKATFKSHTWLGYWGKHMKPPGFKSIREYQKMNHFPGTFQLGRKDRLWRNLSRMLSRFGKKEFDFFPQTYILPADLMTLKTVFEDGGNKHKWIIKPPASARGIGIQVVHKWSEIPKNRPVIVQRYLSHPYLINDSKFDLRIYVYVTSFDPLRIYVYEDGLARFASVKYSYSLKNIHNRFMHLTNYSVNKRNADYESNSDEDVCQGHKWSLKALWIYLQSKGVDSSAIWPKIKDLVIKTIISAESIINSMVKANVRRRYCCHELFGFDVLLDEKLKPWVIEVNISPSLHSNSQLDINVKGGMIRDLFNLAGFMIPEKSDILPNPGPTPDLSIYEPSNDVCIDRRLWTNQKSPHEKAKHLYYTQRHSDEQVQATILDILTPDDIRILTETVDENSRRGDFQRVFPSPTSQPYHAYFEQPRYYNLLLQAWCNKYPTTETRGISLLESCCRKGLHLQNPTSNTKHQWVPPTLNSFTKDIRISGSSPTTNKTCPSESPYTR